VCQVSNRSSRVRFATALAAAALGCGAVEEQTVEPWSGPFDAVMTVDNFNTTENQVFGLRHEPLGTKLLCTGCRFRGLAPDGLVVALSFGDRLDLVASDGQLRSSLPDGTGVFWSPDGAHAVVLTQLGRVFIVGPDGSGPIELLMEPDPHAWAVWSPDSQFLAITTQAGVAIWGPSGSAAALRLLPTFGGTPAWAPDSRRLAVAGADPAGINAATGRFAFDRIDFVDRDGTSTTTVRAQAPPGSGSWSEFSIYGWSSDSEHFAFELETSSQLEGPDRLRIVNARGEAEAAQPGDSTLSGAAWSPRTNILAFEAPGAATPTLVLWSPERSVTIPLPKNFDLAWSPDGSRILARYDSATNGVEASLVDVAAARIVSSFPDGDTRWSPDGSHLVCVRHFLARPIELLTSDAAGENQVPLAQDVESWTWLRDSRYLVVVDSNAIFSIRFDGHDRRELRRHPENSWISFDIGPN
jgi:Tol biopolymer transport system component